MGKVRDFRSETITNIRDNLVDADPNWDAFFDFFYDVFGGPKELETDLSNFNDYMKRICEINDITAEKLDQIIADVQGVESTYSTQFATDAANFNIVASKLDTLIEEISKPDFETSFDPVVTGTALALKTLSDTPPDLSGLSPELIVKVLPLLTEDEVIAILPTLHGDQLAVALDACSLDVISSIDTSQFTPEQQEIYFDYLTQKQIEALIATKEAEWTEWDSWDDARKQQELEAFYDEVLVIMGITGPHDIDFVKGLTTDEGDPVLGLCPHDPIDPKTFIVQIDLKHATTSDIHRVLSTIVHESRHGYQWEVRMDYEARKYFATNPDQDTFPFNVGNDKGSYVRDVDSTNRHPNTTDKTADEWSKPLPPYDPNNKAEYVNNRREWDAFNYADNIDGRISEAEMNPVYPGSWPVL